MMLTLTAPFLVGQRPSLTDLTTYISVCSIISSASPTSMPRYRTVLSSFVWPSNNWKDLGSFVRRKVWRRSGVIAASLRRHCGVIAASFGQARATAIRIFASSMTPRGVIETSTIEDNDAAPRHCGVTRR